MRAVIFHKELSGLREYGCLWNWGAALDLSAAGEGQAMSPAPSSAIWALLACSALVYVSNLKVILIFPDKQQVFSRKSLFIF